MININDDFFKILKSEKEYEEALARAYEIIQQDLEKGSDAYNELKHLTLIIEHYEAQQYIIK